MVDPLENQCAIDLEQNGIIFTVYFANHHLQQDWKNDIEKCITKTRENMAAKKINTPEKLPMIRAKLLERAFMETNALHRMEAENSAMIDQFHELSLEEKNAVEKDLSPVKSPSDGVRVRSYFHKRNAVLEQRREQKLTLITQYESQVMDLEKKMEQQKACLKDTKWLLEQCHQRIITCMGDDRFRELFPLPCLKRPSFEKKSLLLRLLLAKKDEYYNSSFACVYDTYVNDAATLETYVQIIKDTLPSERRSVYSSIEGFNIDQLEEEPIAGVVDTIDPEFDKMLLLSPASKLRRTMSTMTAGSATALEAFVNATQTSYVKRRKSPSS